MVPGCRELLHALPTEFKPFGGAEYPMPVSQALSGGLPDIARLRRELAEAAHGELKDALEAVALAAEAVESAAPDRDKFLMDDGRVRAYVFRGGKWRAGWVLLAGDGVPDSLAEKLKARQYMIFSARHEKLRDHPLPARETGAVYFLQLMVRYAMIWGRIAAGDDHEMAHFLERDMPGAMVVQGAVGPVEGLVLLSLMKMGCPAVVGPEFPYDIGPRAVAKDDDEALQALAGFPNMRVRVIRGQEISLPAGADPAWREQTFEPARVVKGLFQLRPAACEARVTVSGEASSDRVAVIVEVADAKLDLPVSAHLEAQALGYGSYLPGVRTRRDDTGEFRLELAQGAELDAQLVGHVIQCGLRRAFPRLGPVRVRLRFGVEAVEHEAPAAAEFERVRNEATLAESEDTAEEFHACIDCQPFSHAHVCIVTPDRPPMCGRSRNAIKAGALWGADYRPWTRRDVGGAELQHAIAKGPAVDAAAGEWAGVNEAARELTGGKVERVRIHSVCDAPHTSCGCFAALAFRIPGADWIGVMDRGYAGEAPGGVTWSILANRAGGKQSPGVTGISLAYLKSPKALAGEGGLAAVKWATKRCLEAMGPRRPTGARIATEDDATTLDELRAFRAAFTQAP